MKKTPWYLQSWFIILNFTFGILIVPFIAGVILAIWRDIYDSNERQRLNALGFYETANLKTRLNEINDEIGRKDEIRKEIEDDHEDYKKVLYNSLEDLREQLTLLETNYVSEREKQKNQLQAEHQRLSKELFISREQLQDELKEISADIGKAKESYIELREDLLLQEVGIYHTQYDLESSEDYRDALNDIRYEQKEMVRQKTAAVCLTEWTVGESKREGQKMINNAIKMAIRSFNNECDTVIGKVKLSNIESSEKRIRNSFENINKFNVSLHTYITDEYLDSKIKELFLAYEFEVKKAEEKEEQRRIREEEREKERADKEMEERLEAVRKEESHFKKAIRKLRERADKHGMDDDLEEKIEEFEEKLRELEDEKIEVKKRRQLSKAGHVYVISNIGSFGEGVFKIGVTRRLEPMDRVKELGDASVPFLFDVHAMIFSEDAFALEKKLHEAFDHCRVNRVNDKKEFFRVSLDEIKREVKENHNKTAEFVDVPSAEEYRQSIIDSFI